MVAHLVGGVYNEYKYYVSNDVNCLAQNIQRVFQSTVNLTLFPPNVAKLLKLNIWKEFVSAVDDSIESGEILFILV